MYEPNYTTRWTGRWVRVKDDVAFQEVIGEVYMTGDLVIREVNDPEREICYVQPVTDVREMANGRPTKSDPTAFGSRGPVVQCFCRSNAIVRVLDGKVEEHGIGDRRCPQSNQEPWYLSPPRANDPDHLPTLRGE